MCAANGFRSADRKTLKRLLERLPTDLRTMILRGTQEWFLKHGLVGRLEEELPNQRWQMDISEVPIWALCVETGELFKPWKIVVVDACTRCVPDVLYCRNIPDSEDVLQFLRGAFLPKNDPDRPFFGVPRVLQMDNDPRFTGSALERMALALEITLDFIPRACPSADGKIERIFETFNERLYSHLAGYASRFAAKGSAKKRAIPFPLFPRITRKFMLEYHLSIHTSIHASPWERFHELLEHAVGLVWDPGEVIGGTRVLASLPVVGRDGIAMPNGQLYTTPEFATLVGETVDVLRPPHMMDGPVDAFYAGRHVGTLEPNDPLIAAAVADARRARMLSLLEMRELLLEGLRESPPIPDYSVDTKAERVRIKDGDASSMQKPLPVPVDGENERGVTHVPPDGDGFHDGEKAPAAKKRRRVKKFKPHTK